MVLQVTCSDTPMRAKATLAVVRLPVRHADLLSNMKSTVT